MAKVTVQLSDFLVVNVIKADWLINGYNSKNREDREDKEFRLDSEAMPGDGSEKENQGNYHQKANLLFHFFSLFASLRVCQVKINSEYEKSSTGQT
jgi:hypothetical protein